ncbi:class I adenylate-forming enzyme family protein [Marimonas sp. MJW-29]|uniref:Class I adenylate-forming enzyme family protein n=1 Tax=Sulfitobacter sediminis TaxID=3234186 RepID=A0ABV3RRH1_9RHOB
MTIHSVRRGETLDYAETARRVADRVHALSILCAHGPSRVVIGVSDPLDVLVNLFATWAAGHCSVLVNPGLAHDEKTRVRASVTPLLWIDDNGLHSVQGQTPAAPIWPDAALILMTSGTTGVPKGVTHDLKTLETRLRLNVGEIGLPVLARTLCPLPLFFGHGLIGNCLTALYAGQSLHILDKPDLKDLSEFGALLDKLGITFLSSVPSMWRMVLRMSAPPASPPLRVHVGSAPLTQDLWERIEEWCGTRDVFNTYGMTETANWISGGRRPERDADGFVGKPWGGAFRVLRDGGLHDSGRGEVALMSPTMMLGLWGEAGLADHEQGGFLTGDIGELAGDQSLRLVGRAKNEINRGGIKVLAEEVDMLLERHPAIAEACAFGIPDTIAGELVGAVVRANDGAQVTDLDLMAWCRTQARSEAVPSRIEIVSEIAKNDRGKLARQAIQQEMIDRWR